MANISYVIYNYIDDFMLINQEERAWKSFKTLGRLLKSLGVDEAEEKSVALTHVIEFLGVLFDLLRMLLILPQDKMYQIRELLKQWAGRKMMTKKHLQKLVGKLQFASICIRPGRVLIS